MTQAKDKESTKSSRYLDGAVRDRALAGNIVLRSWRRHFTLTVPLSSQVCKWVLVMLGVTL